MTHSSGSLLSHYFTFSQAGAPDRWKVVLKALLLQYEVKGIYLFILCVKSAYVCRSVGCTLVQPGEISRSRNQVKSRRAADMGTGGL